MLRPSWLDGRPPDDGDDPITVGLRISQALEDEDAAAFAAHEPIRARVERLAPPVGRHHVRFRQRDGDIGAENEIYPARNRQVGLCASKAADSLVNRDERRRTGRVDRHAGPACSKQIRQTAGGNAVRGAGGRVGVERVQPGVPEHLQIVDSRHPDEDSRSGLGQPIRVHPRMLQGFPCHLEQEALLRVHALRFSRRDPEEVRVEPFDIREKPSPPRGHPARRVRIRVEIVGDIPSARWHLGDGVVVPSQQLPVPGGCVRAAGKPAADADDGDRRMPRKLQLFDAALERVGEQRQTLWRVVADPAEKVLH